MAKVMADFFDYRLKIQIQKQSICQTAQSLIFKTRLPDVQA